MSCSKCTDAAVYKCKGCNSIFCVPDWNTGHVCNVRLEGKNDRPLIVIISDAGSVSIALVEKAAAHLRERLENFRVEVAKAYYLTRWMNLPKFIFIPTYQTGAQPSLSEQEETLIQRMK